MKDILHSLVAAPATPFSLTRESRKASGAFTMLKRLKFRGRLKNISSCLLALGLTVSTTHATDRVWDGDGSNSLWSNTDNWVGGVVPDNANNGAVFYSGTPSRLNPVVAGSASPAFITLGPNADSNVTITIGDGTTVTSTLLLRDVTGDGPFGNGNAGIFIDPGSAGTHQITNFTSPTTTTERLVFGIGTEVGTFNYYVRNNSSHLFTLNTTVYYHQGSVTRNLRFDGSGNVLVGGPILPFGATGSPVANLIKEGAGTLTLSGANTYNGTTTVTAGSLLVNGNSSGATGAVSVDNAATLGGTGTVGGATTVNAGGILAPGTVTSAGTVTFSTSLSLSSTSVLEWDLNASNQTVGGGINDLATVGTNLTLDGTINVTLSGGPQITSAGTWRLFNYGGTLTNNGLTIGSLNLAPGLSASIDTSIANQVNLSVVPEPSTFALLALGGLAAGLALRRRAVR